MMRANGSLDFLSNELDVGTALMVERMYREEQLESGEAVTLVYKENAAHISTRHRAWHIGRDVNLTLGGRMIGGGGRSSSVTLKGWVKRSVGYSWLRAAGLFAWAICGG
jgi:hypothetical protein